MAEERSETNMHGNSRLFNRLSFTIQMLQTLKNIEKFKDEDLKNRVEHLIGEISKIPASVWRHNVYAWLYIVGWYFVVPIGMAVFALVMIYYA
ncbi:MAG: hypothetical protein E4H18_02215 [Hyphomicrobiales bacterium]|nr:MAG: hypothetical protein E4H18_02215 [Hyphomicrobiales bacterium]